MVLGAGKAGGKEQGGRGHTTEQDSLLLAPGSQWCLAQGAKKPGEGDKLGVLGMSTACWGIRNKILTLQASYYLNKSVNKKEQTLQSLVLKYRTTEQYHSSNSRQN